MIRYIFEKLWKGWGWKLAGIDPREVPKKVYVVIPHTSNWDFPVGYLLKVWYPLDVRWVGKSQLFRWPFGRMFKAMGGIPVDRAKAKDFVGTMIELYGEHNVFSTAIAPEGTRKKVEKLKSGYFRIANGANVPIIYTKFDWKNKIVHFAEPKMAESTWEQELAYATNHFKDTVGCVPENSFNYPFEKEK